MSSTPWNASVGTADSTGTRLFCLSGHVEQPGVYEHPHGVTVGEAIENVPGKFFKEADVWVKTKTPVLVLKTDNDIPKE